MSNVFDSDGLLRECQFAIAVADIPTLEPVAEILNKNAEPYCLGARCPNLEACGSLAKIALTAEAIKQEISTQE